MTLAELKSEVSKHCERCEKSNKRKCEKCEFMHRVYNLFFPNDKKGAGNDRK